MSGEKTEQPTQKRLRDARRKGQVAKSREIPSSAIIIGIFVTLWILSDLYMKHFKELLVLGTRGYGAPFDSALEEILGGVVFHVVVLTLPLLLLVIVLSAAANFFQVGAMFSGESIKPDLKRFDPGAALKKIFSKKSLIELVKSLLLITFLSCLFYSVIKNALPAILAIPYGGVETGYSVCSAILKKIVVYTSIAFVTMAAADYFLQKVQFLKEMKMSKAEVKQEYKEMEGDPLIKSKRKQLHRELTMNNMLQNVRKATVIITNPTRLAIALYYEKEEGKLPRVLGKGENLLAKRIVQIAQEEDIPILTNVPLAQDLYEKVGINQFIPSDLIDPVAEVLRWVYQIKKQKVT